MTESLITCVSRVVNLHLLLQLVSRDMTFKIFKSVLLQFNYNKKIHTTLRMFRFKICIRNKRKQGVADACKIVKITFGNLRPAYRSRYFLLCFREDQWSNSVVLKFIQCEDPSMSVRHLEFSNLKKNI
jgi:hypothetical protein